MSEEYSVGYEAGYQDGWNAAVEQPVRTKDLTDDEIKAAYESWYESNGNHAFPIWVGAKAVIVKFKEKNNVKT